MMPLITTASMSTTRMATPLPDQPYQLLEDFKPRQLPAQPKNMWISGAFSIAEWGAVPKWVAGPGMFS